MTHKAAQSSIRQYHWFCAAPKCIKRATWVSLEERYGFVTACDRHAKLGMLVLGQCFKRLKKPLVIPDYWEPIKQGNQWVGAKPPKKTIGGQNG